MSTCEACTIAATRPTGQYRQGCIGCSARAVARSMAAFKAVVEKDPAPLRETLERVFPALSYEQARRLVWAWWQSDHPQQKGD